VVSQNLALVVKQFFSKENKPPTLISIPIPWKDPPLHITTAEIQDTSKTNEANNTPSSTYH